MRRHVVDDHVRCRVEDAVSSAHSNLGAADEVFAVGRADRRRLGESVRARPWAQRAAMEASRSIHSLAAQLDESVDELGLDRAHREPLGRVEPADVDGVVAGLCAPYAYREPSGKYVIG
jgi:hypothetical protein